VRAREALIQLLGGLAAGVAGGLLGIGGGLVLIPLLIGYFRLTQHAANGTSLAVIGATAASSLVIYGQHATVAWWTAVWVALASTLTVRFGSAYARRLSSAQLSRVFAVFLVLVAGRLLWKPAGQAPSIPPAATIPVEIGIGVVVGLIAGMMGVGGGVLAVPAFTLLLGMSQRLAQGTSLAVILVTAPVGTIDNSRHGNVAWKLVPMLALGAAIGGPVASVLAHRVPQEALARTFAIFMLAQAIFIWRRAGRATKPAAA
jgi:uncharacterized membrane protein YfcA